MGMAKYGFLAIVVSFADPAVKVVAAMKEYKNVNQLEDRHPEGNCQKPKESSEGIEKVENG